MEVTGIIANCYRPSNRQTDRPTTKVSYKGQLLDLLCIASSWTYNILFIGSSWNGFCKKNPFRYYNVFFIVSLWLRILKNCFRYYNMFFIVSSWLRIFKNCFRYYKSFYMVSDTIIANRRCLTTLLKTMANRRCLTTLVTTMDIRECSTTLLSTMDVSHSVPSVTTARWQGLLPPPPQLLCQPQQKTQNRENEENQ